MNKETNAIDQRSKSKFKDYPQPQVVGTFGSGTFKLMPVVDEQDWQRDLSHDADLKHAINSLILCHVPESMQIGNGDALAAQIYNMITRGFVFVDEQMNLAGI